MSDAPGGGAKVEPQAAIAKHAAITQAGAGDAAIIARVENSIQHSPMGWLQGVLGETSSRASAESGEVHGKIAEHEQLVSSNQKDAPKDAGPAPAPGPAAHPAVPAPATAAPAATAAPKTAEAAGGAAENHAVPAHPVTAATGAAAPSAAPAPTIAGAVSGAGDGQIDGILNAYTPKSPQATQTMGRIKQMGDVAQGFNGQLDTYVAQGGNIEHAVAASANFLGVGKDTSAVWANNPYRKVHGVLGGIMTGLSSVKSVCAVVGSICGKIGMVLTVIGLLGMIFPPIGAAVSGIARILNVVGVICDAIAFVLSGILTGLNGVVLAQQIGAGASAEEKAATADLMMSEANDAASGFVNLAMMFGPKFMKGMLGSSKGIVASLLKRARATIGRVSLKVTGNVSHFANKIVRKLGLGGAGGMARAGGAWKSTGFVASAKEKFAASTVGKAFNGAPGHIQGVQDKLMAKYGNTGWAKNMDRMGAWGGSVAHRFDLEDKVGKFGESSGKALGGLGAESAFGKRLAASAERSEFQTRELTMKMGARDAAHLEETRWKRELDRRAASAPEGRIRSKEAEGNFVSSRGDNVRREQSEQFEHAERGREQAERVEQMKAQRVERRNDEYLDNKTNGLTGASRRDEMMGSVHGARQKRWDLEAQFKAQETERKALLGKATKSTEEQARLTALNGELRSLDEARRINKLYEKDLSGLTAGPEREREPFTNWKDVGSNAWEATAPVVEMMNLGNKGEAVEDIDKKKWKDSAKYNKGTAKSTAAGRGGHGTFGDIAKEQRDDNLASVTEFVRAGKKPTSVSGSVRGMLSGITNRGAKPQQPAAAPTASPIAAPQPRVAAAAPQATPQVTAEEHPAPSIAQAPAEPEEAKETPDAEGGEALPYWPSLLPEFEHASQDFGYMRKVAVEFKKSQIEGKQKAVNTLAVYGRYKEYAQARAAAAAKNQQGAQQTGAATQQNVAHASQTEGQAGQGEAKQAQAKGAASDKAATDLPEPASTGFWGNILGAVKRWAKNKAAQVFGWIQEKIASVIMKGLCGVSMGDMREYAGALRHQQQLAHGVADGAGAKSGQVQSTSVKLGADANKEAQDAADAIGECDKNITDADTFMADVASFEQQLAEEKAHAQLFINNVHAQARAEQAKRAAETAKRDQDRQKASSLSAGVAAGVTQAAEAQPEPPSATAEEPATTNGPEQAPEQQQDESQIHAASAYVATEADAMTSKIEGRADDYTNQLAFAMMNRTGKDDQGADLKGPAKKESKHIVEAFKEEAKHTKLDMDAMRGMAIDPSHAHSLADTIIQSATHLESSYDQSENALDELFTRTYQAIKDGKRSLKSQIFDGDHAVGHANQEGEELGKHAVSTALPQMNKAWDKVAKPIAVPASARAAPAPDAAPPMYFKAKGGESPVDGNRQLNSQGGSEVPFRAEMEAQFGENFSSVTVSFGEHGAMDEIGARGVTQGEHITFAQTSPEKELVAHELTHIVQQRRGKASQTTGAEVASHERAGLESEADAIGQKAARGEHVGEVAGETKSTGFRQDDPKAVDVMPPKQLLQVAGDRFEMSFRREGGEFICDVAYVGDLKVEGPGFRGNTDSFRAHLADATRKINAKIVKVGASSVELDVYSDGLVKASISDTSKPGWDQKSREHMFSWAVGAQNFGGSGAMFVMLPTTPGSGPDGKEVVAGTKTTHFKAVDDFTLSVVRFGDTKSASVTLTAGAHSFYANPQSFVVPIIEGSLDHLEPKVLSNTGRDITIDLNGDGKQDLSFVHTIEARTEGKGQTRSHHFRQFDKDGVLLGDRSDGMLYAFGGPAVEIPATQDESKNAPLNKEAPLDRAPKQGDVAGELPQANPGPGGVIEMRVDGDGDRTKELSLRLKPMPAANRDAPGQLRVEVIQLSSVGASGKAETLTFDVPADALRDFNPFVTDVADGLNPMTIHFGSSNTGLKIMPPRNDQAGLTRTYMFECAGKLLGAMFPAETTAENPLIKSATVAQTLGNVHRLEVTLGEFNDKFWVMNEGAVLSIAAINAEGPAASRGFPIALPAGKQVTSFVQVNAGSNNLAIDLDGDGKPDVQIYDALSAPPLGGTGPAATLVAERDHKITVNGVAVGGAHTFGFWVRNGRFQGSEGGEGANKQAASSSNAVSILQDQADESRSKDETGKAKEGDIDALLSRVVGGLTAARQKAMEQKLITPALFNSWSQLSEELIKLGPQIKANKVDAKLQGAAAGHAGTFCSELEPATSSGDEMTSVDEFNIRTKNKYTGKEKSESVYGAGSPSISGPSLRLPNEIRMNQWQQVTADFDLLVHGLDKWISDSMKKGSAEAQQQQYLVGMQERMSDVKAKPGVQRVMASFQPDASYNQNTQKWSEVPLTLFAWKEDGKWWLQDVTNPSREPFLDKVDASDTDKEPPASIFKQLDYARHFPKGIIHYQIPNGAGGSLVTTERKSWTDFMQWVGLGLAVVGIGLATFGTGAVAATAAAVAFAASGVAGAVYAGGDLYQRAQHGDLEPAAVVMDIAQIAAGIFGAAAAISGRIVTAAAQADIAATQGAEGAAAWTGAAARIAQFSQKMYIPALAGSAGADGVNLLAMGADTIAKISEIKNGDGSEPDKKTAIAQLIAQTLVLGGITILSIKGSMPEIASGRPTIALDIVNGIPVARANSISVGKTKIQPSGGGANGEATARWQSHAFEESAETSPKVKGLSEDPEFMKGYKAWMEQPEPKVAFVDGKPKANFGKGTNVPPEIQTKIQKEVVDVGGVSLYERAWVNADGYKKIEDAIAKTGGKDGKLVPGTPEWTKHRAEIVKSLGGDAAAEENVAKYERAKAGADASDPRGYATQYSQLERVIPDGEIQRIRGMFPEYEVYVSGGASQTARDVKPEIDDVDVIVVVPHGTPRELCAAIEQRVRGQVIRPDPAFIQLHNMPADTKLTIDVKVMTDDQFFGFVTASSGAKKSDGSSSTAMNFTRIDQKAAAVDDAIEKGGSGQQWLDRLSKRLDETGRENIRLRMDKKTRGYEAQGPQDIYQEFGGDMDLAIAELSKKEGGTPAPSSTTATKYCKPRPKDVTEWDWAQSEANWTDARKALHDQWIEKAKADARQFADEIEKSNPDAQPTMYAMRGNTAAGKTRAVTGNVPEMQAPMAATKNVRHRAVNPDNFKLEIYGADPGLTSTQVHTESSMLAKRLENELQGLTTSSGKQASILIDKRLAKASEVTAYMDLARKSGRKFVLYDVDAPLEASLVGVLERAPGKEDPLPPFNIVADGFEMIHGGRSAVIDEFAKPENAGFQYVLYGTKPNGARVQIASCAGGSKPVVTDAELFADALIADASAAARIGQKRINNASIKPIQEGLDAERAAAIVPMLRKYEGWTWKEALDHHAAEKAAASPAPKK